MAAIKQQRTGPMKYEQEAKGKQCRGVSWPGVEMEAGAFLNFQQFTLKAFSAQMTHRRPAGLRCPVFCPVLVLAKATMMI